MRGADEASAESREKSREKSRIGPKGPMKSADWHYRCKRGGKRVNGRASASASAAPPTEAQAYPLLGVEHDHARACNSRVDRDHARAREVLYFFF